MERLRDASDLPEPFVPEEPEPRDCCGLSCNPCVFDIYCEEKSIWLARASGDNSDTTRSYRRFTLDKVTTISSDTNVYRFSTSTPTGNLRPGQHLILKLAGEKRALTRQFTPIVWSNGGYFDVVIKLYKHGRMSQRVAMLKVGDECEWRGPFGDFTYEADKYERVLMLAAGTGIAPMAQIVRFVLESTAMTRLRLLYACRSRDEVLLRTELDEWSKVANFSVRYFLSKESPVGERVVVADTAMPERARDEVVGRRIELADVREELLAFTERDAGRVKVLICGTKSFDKDMINYVKKCGLSAGDYFRF